MGKLLFFFLFFSLILNVTLQSTAGRKRGRKRGRNNSEVAVLPVQRTFPGVLLLRTPIEAKSLSLVPNGTNTSVAVCCSSSPPSPSPPPPTPPALRLLSNSTGAYLRGALSTRLIPGVYALVVLVGVPANVAILSALAAKARKVSSAILYRSLAVSDLLLLLSLVLKAHYHLRGNHWAFGEAACRAVTACFYGNLYCSAHTLACVGVQRYLAVVRPFVYRGLPKRACSICAVLAVWGVFGAAVVPELLIQQSYRLPQLGVTTCHDVLPLDHASPGPLLYYRLGLTVLGLLLPLVVTTGCFVRIVYELNRSHGDWARYVKASWLVFVIFLVCFGPAGATHFLHYALESGGGAGGGGEAFYAYFSVAACLCCLHACLDPFLFLLMSRSYGANGYAMGVKGKTLSVST